LLNRPRVTFTAYGTNTVALDCNGGACQAVDSPLLVKGSLLSPVAITPAYAEGPTGHAKPGCVAAAQDPSFVISQIFYGNQTGDGVTAVPYQSLNLLLTNPATGYQTGCFPIGLDEDLNLMCAGVEFQSEDTGKYSLQTTATFDNITMTFAFNQTWYCDDVDAAKP